MLQLKLSYGTEKISCLMSRHYLDDAIGYLFLSKEEKANDVGVFFVQCT